MWHLQVCRREWVVWWYGPREDGLGHIDPAETVIALSNGGELRIPFTLPSVADWCRHKPPQELRRVVCWGWRIRTNDGIHDTGWHLTDTREQCCVDATAYVESDSRNAALTPALLDVREYLHGLW